MARISIRPSALPARADRRPLFPGGCVSSCPPSTVVAAPGCGPPHVAVRHSPGPSVSKEASSNGRLASVIVTGGSGMPSVGYPHPRLLPSTRSRPRGGGTPYEGFGSGPSARGGPVPYTGHAHPYAQPHLGARPSFGERGSETPPHPGYCPRAFSTPARRNPPTARAVEIIGPLCSSVGKARLVYIKSH